MERLAKQRPTALISYRREEDSWKYHPNHLEWDWKIRNHYETNDTQQHCAKGEPAFLNNPAEN